MRKILSLLVVAVIATGMWAATTYEKVAFGQDEALSSIVARRSFGPNAKVELNMDTLRYVYGGNDGVNLDKYTGYYIHFRVTAKISNSGSTVSKFFYRFESYSDAALTKRVYVFTTTTNDLYISSTAANSFASYWRVLAAETEAELNDATKRLESPVRTVYIYRESDICRNGVLLFREDFGGNDVEDADIRTSTPKYLTLANTYFVAENMTMQKTYCVRKKGYKYGDAYSHWHIQDDHTHSGDYTRGYFLEVNGAPGKEKVYSTRLDDVKSGAQLTFTAYFANVVTQLHVGGNEWYNGQADPAFRLEVRDAAADTVIINMPSGIIPRRGQYNYNDWQNSSPWTLIGFPFEVPDKVTSLEFNIYNDVASGTIGMDYALDDIEIRRCDLPVTTITSPVGACAGDTYNFTHTFVNDGQFAKTLQYRWQKLTGEHEWSDQSSDATWTLNAIQLSDAGTYRLLVGDGLTIDKPNSCSVSEPFDLVVTRCDAQTMVETACPEGTVLQSNDYNNVGTAQLQLTDIWPGMPYNISVHAKRQSGDNARLRMTVKEASSGRLVGTFDSDVLADNDWHDIATGFVVPDWTYNVIIDISGISNDGFVMFDNAAVRLCVPKLRLRATAEAICKSNPYLSFLSDYTADETFGTKVYYSYQYSADGVTWTELIRRNSKAYTQRPLKYGSSDWNLQEGYYRVCASSESLLDKLNCRAASEPIYLRHEDNCAPFLDPAEDAPSPYVCEDGTLLFREDFGGNDQSAPAQSQTPSPQMASSGYQFVTNEYMGGSNKGSYRIVKYGAQNSINKSNTESLGSQWHIQDDHTYPNDYTRGYFLEIDGGGGSVPFYSTELNLCHELDMSFSAYVANVQSAADTRSRNTVRPKVKFLIEDADMDTVVHEVSSDTVSPGWQYEGWPGSYTMYTLAPWHLVGTNFHVPNGVEHLRLSIYNDVPMPSSDGNDFALDDIEIRLCNPQVDITSAGEACIGSNYTFVTSLTGNNPFQPPYQFRWEFAADSLEWNDPGWTTIVEAEELRLMSITPAHDGWYRMTVSGNGNIDNTYCRARSKPFHLKVIDCTPPVLPELAIVSESEMCMDSAYCFALDTLNKATYGEANYTYWWEISSDEQQTWTKKQDGQNLCFNALTMADSCWYRIATNYMDPHNNVTEYSEPFLLRVRDCSIVPPDPPLPQPVITSEHVVCADSAYCFEVAYKNAADIPDTCIYAYQWEYSKNGRLFADLSAEKDLCLNAVTPADTMWYRLNISWVYPALEGSVTSRAFRLDIKDCAPDTIPVLPPDTTPVLPPDTVPVIPPDTTKPIEPSDLCLDGALFFHEDFGGNDVSAPEQSTELPPGLVQHAATYYIVKKGIQNGIQWHLQDDHTFFNDYSRGYILEVDMRGGAMMFYKTIVDGLIPGKEMTFSISAVNLTYAGQIPYLEQKFGYVYPSLRLCVQDTKTGKVIANKSMGNLLPDSTKKWDLNLSESADWQLFGVQFKLPDDVESVLLSIYNDAQKSGAGNDFAIDDIELRMCGASLQRIDTTACDTLLPILWHGREWNGAGTQTDTIKNTSNEDSVYVQYRLEIEHCCPKVFTASFDTIVCDTLLPFSWEFGDTVLLFTEIGEQKLTYPHTKWADCIGEEYTFRLDTVYCEKLYDLLVNKYNWVIVCDNTRLAEYFPEQQPTAYKWYKNGKVIEGATTDDYSEEAELNGVFQLQITLPDKTIRTKELTINASGNAPIRIACYNNLGLPVSPDMPLEELPQGIYIVVYQYGDNTRSEKVFVK